jgi:hypothetical protein
MAEATKSSWRWWHYVLLIGGVLLVIVLVGMLLMPHKSGGILGGIFDFIFPFGSIF